MDELAQRQELFEEYQRTRGELQEFMHKPANDPGYEAAKEAHTKARVALRLFDEQNGFR